MSHKSYRPFTILSFRLQRIVGQAFFGGARPWAAGRGGAGRGEVISPAAAVQGLEAGAPAALALSLRGAGRLTRRLRSHILGRIHADASLCVMSSVWARRRCSREASRAKRPGDNSSTDT